VIADHANGTVTSGASYGIQDTTATTETINTTALAEGVQYWVAVSGAVDGSTVVTTPFTAITLDRNGPTGTYTENRRSGFLIVPEDEDPFESDGIAQFTFHQTSLADNITPSAQITRTVTPGDGQPATVWATGDFTVSYKKAGTYVPVVNLTDKAGNTSHVSLPSVTVLKDVTPPTVRVTKPAKPTKVASWRRVSGTATDAGTGVDSVAAMVLEKRAGIWWAHDCRHKKWLKG
jgi:hypothetical protein